MDSLTPANLLLIVSGVMGLIAAAEWWRVRRRRRILRRLARDWQMHYTPHDRFQIGTRIAMSLPVSGAAAVRVTDLIYAQHSERYQYLFTAEYSAGTVGGLTRRFAVVAFSEPRAPSPLTQISPRIAPEELPLPAQYEKLHPHLMQGERADAHERGVTAGSIPR